MFKVIGETATKAPCYDIKLTSRELPIVSIATTQLHASPQQTTLLQPYPTIVIFRILSLYPTKRKMDVCCRCTRGFDTSHCVRPSICSVQCPAASVPSCLLCKAAGRWTVPRTGHANSTWSRQTASHSTHSCCSIRTGMRGVAGGKCIEAHTHTHAGTEVVRRSGQRQLWALNCGEIDEVC